MEVWPFAVSDRNLLDLKSKRRQLTGILPFFSTSIASVLLTPFRRQVLPPPMYATKVDCPANLSSVSFAPNSYEIGALLTNSSIALWSPFDVSNQVCACGASRFCFTLSSDLKVRHRAPRVWLAASFQGTPNPTGRASAHP